MSTSPNRQRVQLGLLTVFITGILVGYAAALVAISSVCHLTGVVWGEPERFGSSSAGVRVDRVHDAHVLIAHYSQDGLDGDARDETLPPNSSDSPRVSPGSRRLSISRGVIYKRQLRNFLHIIFFSCVLPLVNLVFSGVVLRFVGLLESFYKKYSQTLYFPETLGSYSSWFRYLQSEDVAQGATLEAPIPEFKDEIDEPLSNEIYRNNYLSTPSSFSTSASSRSQEGSGWDFSSSPSKSSIAEPSLALETAALEGFPHPSPSTTSCYTDESDRGAVRAASRLDITFLELDDEDSELPLGVPTADSFEDFLVSDDYGRELGEGDAVEVDVFGEVRANLSGLSDRVSNNSLFSSSNRYRSTSRSSPEYPSFKLPIAQLGQQSSESKVSESDVFGEVKFNPVLPLKVPVVDLRKSRLHRALKLKVEERLSRSNVNGRRRDRSWERRHDLARRRDPYVRETNCDVFGNVRRNLAGTVFDPATRSRSQDRERQREIRLKIEKFILLNPEAALPTEHPSKRIPISRPHLHPTPGSPSSKSKSRTWSHFADAGNTSRRQAYLRIRPEPHHK